MALCKICEAPLAAKLADTLLASGESPARVALALKDGGLDGVGPVRVEFHLRECRGGDVKVAKVAGGPKEPKDFAMLVRERAIEKMENGELDVTTQHGLQAQQMIDARDQKQKDRDLMLALARVIGGTLAPASVIISDVPYAELDAGPDILQTEDAEALGG